MVGPTIFVLLYHDCDCLKLKIKVLLWKILIHYLLYDLHPHPGMTAAKPKSTADVRIILPGWHIGTGPS